MKAPRGPATPQRPRPTLGDFRSGTNRLPGDTSNTFHANRRARLPRCRREPTHPENRFEVSVLVHAGFVTVSTCIPGRGSGQTTFRNSASTARLCMTKRMLPTGGKGPASPRRIFPPPVSGRFAGPHHHPQRKLALPQPGMASIDFVFPPRSSRNNIPTASPSVARCLPCVPCPLLLPSPVKLYPIINPEGRIGVQAIYNVGGPT